MGKSVTCVAIKRRVESLIVLIRKVFLFAHPHPLLPYVAPHFSHISHF